MIIYGVIISINWPYGRFIHIVAVVVNPLMHSPLVVLCKLHTSFSHRYVRRLDPILLKIFWMVPGGFHCLFICIAFEYQRTSKNQFSSCLGDLAELADWRLRCSSTFLACIRFWAREPFGRTFCPKMRGQKSGASRESSWVGSMRANLMKYLPTGDWLMLVYIMCIYFVNLCYVFQLVFLKGGRMGFFELGTAFAAQLSNRFIPGIRSMGFDGWLRRPNFLPKPWFS